MTNEYESLLDEAFVTIKPTEFVDRFDVMKVEGRHEGTKTVITNFTQIASHFRRTPDHISRFLFKELASPGNVDGDRLIFVRKLASKQINEKLEKYVEKFVKCSKCGKPDTELVVDGGKNFIKCMACGTKKEFYNI